MEANLTNPNATENSSPSSPAEREQSPEQSTRMIERLFAHFTALYGNAKLVSMWEGQDLERVKAIWSEYLSRLSLEEIRTGLDRLVAQGRAFPPTLPEFFATCRPPVIVPPEADHRGIENLAQQLGVRIMDCPTYGAARSRILAHLQNETQPLLRLVDGR